MQNPSAPDPNALISLVRMRMPFGKYKDYLLCNLPVSSLEWMHSKGWPAGRLGQQLATIYEIKINGLDYILKPLKEGKF